MSALLSPTPVQDDDCSHAPIASDQPLPLIIAEAPDGSTSAEFDHDARKNRRRNPNTNVGCFEAADIWPIRE